MNAMQFQVDDTCTFLSFNLDKISRRRLTDREFFDFCQQNPDWRIEMNRTGDVIIMPNTGGNTGRRNSKINFQLQLWAQNNQSGEVFDSSTTFRLPNSAMRSPDASWLAIERWNALTENEKDRFPPICPDFVIELRSRTDALKVLQAKMLEYIENGAQLGWLIDPTNRKVYIYRPNATMQTLDDPQNISGASLLQGFELDLTDIFE